MRATMSTSPRKTWWMIVLTAPALLTAGLRADDWPQWLGPQRDGIWRETGIVDKFPAGGPPIRWRVPLGAGYAGPAVAAGRVYVLDRQLAPGAQNPKNPFDLKKAIAGTERVLCLNAADGRQIWKHEYECPYRISYPSGPRTTPTIRDGRVYTLGAEGNLLCLDAEHGNVQWAVDFKKQYQAKTPVWGFSSSPLLDGNRLVCMVGGKGHTVVAFDKDTGKELWRALTAKEPGYCPPMIYEIDGKRQLIVWDSDNVSALDPETGSVYWSQPLSTYSAMSIATPRLSGNALLFTAYPDTNVLLRPHAGSSTAQVVWKGKPKKRGLFSVFTTPFIDDGYIYGASTKGQLACVKADTGEVVWESLAYSGSPKAKADNPLLIKNGDRYFIMTEKGDLVIARLSPQGYQELSRAHLVDPTTPGMGYDVVWSYPAFADRCIFMRNDKEIMCASLAAEPK